MALLDDRSREAVKGMLGEGMQRPVHVDLYVGADNEEASQFSRDLLSELAAIEARLLMGAMTAKYRPDGFLYYSLSIWNQNRPIEKGPSTSLHRSCGFSGASSAAGTTLSPVAAVTSVKRTAN